MILQMTPIFVHREKSCDTQQQTETASAPIEALRNDAEIVHVR